jgi:NAD(P)-dependent dehydrogenase (short-subunit alcohol dehydrogenase family)
MKILQFGSMGTVGAAVLTALRELEHNVFAANFEEGDLRVDITKSSSIAGVYSAVGKVDAVVCTVGVVPLKPLSQTTKADVDDAVAGKLSAQIDIVLQGLEYLNPRGSFTLISGIMSRVPWPGGIGATIVDSGLDAFVMGAAAELGQDRRINAVSPTIIAESVANIGVNLLPGHEPVPVTKVAAAFVRSVAGIESGKVFAVGI